jgi:hypothetical protein
MTSESRLPIVIFVALVALITGPLLVNRFREQRRPVLAEVRIVSATADDPVFREGRRRVDPGVAVEVAVATRISRRGRSDEWLAPVARLAIDGKETEHVETGRWPETGRTMRVFWFSVESANLGGSLSADNAGERLQYRTFYAPEMGRGLRAVRLPEAHNDDHIGSQAMTALSDAGTVRIYARVEVVEADSDLRPLQAITTIGTDAVLDPDFPAILLSADFGESVDASVGELFRLPGFEPRSETGDWNSVTIHAFHRSFTDLVSDRVVVSSRTLAAVAAAGTPDVDRAAFASLGDLTITSDRVVRDDRTLSWGRDVLPGDLLVDGGHWIVLLGDDGNGDLDPVDPVLHCWGRPPVRTTLFATLERDEATMDHLRYAD